MAIFWRNVNDQNIIYFTKVSTLLSSFHAVFQWFYEDKIKKTEKKKQEAFVAKV